jgi:mono/diheme cytochrome c family protein
VNPRQMNREDNQGHPRVNRAPRWLIGALLALAFAGCDNMQHQRSAKDVGGAPGTADLVSRTAPPFTVARGAPDPGDPAFTGFLGGKPLERTPRTVTRELLAQGRGRFNIYCAVCHGEDGYGAGIVVRRGFPAPASLHDPRLRAAPDGHLFDVMTRGYGVMLPFADRLTPDERWAVVAYVRALQRSQRVALRDLPAADQAHFSAP